MSQTETGARGTREAGDRPRKLHAITFDFWNTLVDGRATEASAAARTARVQAALREAGYAMEAEAVRAAMRRGFERIAREQRASGRDVGPIGRWDVLANELGEGGRKVAYSTIELAYTELTLEPLPALLPGVADAIRTLRSLGYRLGVICNTGMAGGEVLRQLLARHQLLGAFHATTWSNEVGWSKPSWHIFRRALDELHVEAGSTLHVGDLEWADVEGALSAGMHAALYAPVADDEVTTRAELVVTNWLEFPTQVRELEARLFA